MEENNEYKKEWKKIRDYINLLPDKTEITQISNFTGISKEIIYELINQGKFEEVDGKLRNVSKRKATAMQERKIENIDNTENNKDVNKSERETFQEELKKGVKREIEGEMTQEQKLELANRILARYGIEEVIEPRDISKLVEDLKERKRKMELKPYEKEMLEELEKKLGIQPISVARNTVSSERRAEIGRQLQNYSNEKNIKRSIDDKSRLVIDLQEKYGKRQENGGREI